jgi:hypothetical protein
VNNLPAFFPVEKCTVDIQTIENTLPYGRKGSRQCLVHRVAIVDFHHAITVEKSALTGEGGGGGCTATPSHLITITYKVAGEGGGARPPPLHLLTITYKVTVYAPAERADTLPLSHIYPYHVLCGLVNRERDPNWHGIFRICISRLYSWKRE